MKVRFFICFAVFSCLANFAFGKDWSKYDKIMLWDEVPQNKSSHSYMYALKPENAKNPEAKNKTAVIVAPGGSYHHLDTGGEGWTTAEWFREQGAVSFVVHYRVSHWGFHHPAMIEDLQYTIRYARENAEKYGIDKDKLIIIGFSAGGHLVTMGGAFHDRNELEKLGITTNESLKPNFVVPVYPVVSMQDDIGHKWSRKSLLTRKYTKEQQDAFSMEMNIPDDMPPTYLVACEDDPVVIYENSVRLDKALTEKNIPHVFASYKKGKHGFGMRPEKSMIKKEHWNESLKEWLVEMGAME